MEFYQTALGRIVESVLRQSLDDISVPRSDQSTDQHVWLSPIQPFREKWRPGICTWGEKDHLSDAGARGDFVYTDDSWPFKQEEIASVIMLHSFEFLTHPDAFVATLWQSLVSDGELVLFVPNRSGLWARGDRNPFGQGKPYSKRQIVSLLNKGGFVIDSVQPLLFCPPTQNKVFLKSFSFIENVGQKFLPAGGGIYKIVARKVEEGMTPVGFSFDMVEGTIASAP